ncbi:GTP cyclohydrolase I [Streptomyces sp. NPDC056159]
MPVRSLCEHPLLPFAGTAHAGHLPGARILGLSKPTRAVERFTCHRSPELGTRPVRRPSADRAVALGPGEVAEWAARLRDALREELSA